jgi:hypothetical protein
MSWFTPRVGPFSQRRRRGTAIALSVGVSPRSLTIILVALSVFGYLGCG